MRIQWLFALAAAIPATAFADSSHGRSVVEPRTLDAPCRSLAQVPTDARILQPTLEANISVANCMALVRERALVLKPGEPAAQALEQSIQPSLVLLDTVIKTGDVLAQILAQHAKADLYAGLRVRLLATVPRLAPNAVGPAIKAHDLKIAELDTVAQPWKDKALAGMHEVTRLAGEAPELVSRDPVLAFAVSDARLERSTVIGRR